MIKKLIAIFLSMFAALAFAAVDVNKATPAELDGIKGIGPAISSKIVAERAKGNFKDWADFVERVKGVGEGNAARFSAEGLTVNGKTFAGVPAKSIAPAVNADAAPAAAPAPKADMKAATAAAAPAVKADMKTDMKAAAPAAAAKPAEMSAADKKAAADKAKADKKAVAEKEKADKKAAAEKAKAEKADKAAAAKAEKTVKAGAAAPAASAAKK